MRLDHFNIAAPWALLETVRNFYVDVLGFEEGPRPPFDRRGYWLYSDGKPLIHLIESDGHEAAGKRHETPGFIGLHVYNGTGGMFVALLERIQNGQAGF